MDHFRVIGRSSNWQDADNADSTERLLGNNAFNSHKHSMIWLEQYNITA